MKLIQYQRPIGWACSPFDQVNELQNEVNRLFGFGGFGLPGRGENSGTWNPALDLHEDKNNLVVKVEVPGVKKEEIEIAVHDGVLTVSGERKLENETKEGESYRTERYFGKFQRSVLLPNAVAADKATASYKDGILTITLPKSEEAKPKQIPVGNQ